MKTTTTNKKLICLECKNEIDLSIKPLQVGQVVECPFCGTEYEVTKVLENGEYELVIVQEEK